ncbi:uncharacterized protein LY89DRAFT_266617 [Mollisia scopiformis]|uniref:C2H2-type domain-containing protein n=1 Tax=Mollisia scopiformis TaxID=149040 RepID=A0A132BDL8_MOLSC|nr:uncharacterized protein LY89DRAFT_266617 [Mollisia scopiformis]KUJ09934.1 hypothetical protein LY89DRAFT_266617 [Mollisia scopiformis]
MEYNQELPSSHRSDHAGSKDNLASRVAPTSHFSPTDAISTKGNLAFELDEDGAFAVCDSISSLNNVETMSESSSLEGNVNTIPDIDSVDDDDFSIPSKSSNFNDFPRPGNYELIAYCGTHWDEQALLPWRLEPVKFEDLVDLTFEPKSYDTSNTNFTNRSDVMKDKVHPQFPQWSSRFLPRSIAGSSDSIPPLTEDCSRDSDSVAVSEPILNRVDVSRFSQVFVQDKPENSSPISPHLPGIDERFGGKFEYDTATVLAGVGGVRENSPPGPWPELDCFLPRHSNVDEGEDCLENISSSSPMEESTDSDSVWMSDYSESAPVLEDNHPFWMIQPIILREALLSFQAWQQRPQEGSTPSTSSASAPSSGGKTDKSSQNKRQYQPGGRGKGDEENEDDQGGSQKRPRMSKKVSGHQVSFACPFAKKDPLRYRSCHAYVINRIQDVKTHLSRYHQLPIYCPRCMSTFVTESERDEHNRASMPCPVEEVIPYEGVTRAQKDQLSQRVSSKMALSEQWFAIFDILFPGHSPRPRSAYMNVDLTEDLEAFQNLMHAEGPRIIATAITSSGMQISSLANEERDLSALLESVIGEGLQTIAQLWSARLFPDPGVAQPGLSEGSTSYLAPQSVVHSQTSSDTLVNSTHQRQTLQTHQPTFATSENMVFNNVQPSRSEDHQSLAIGSTSQEPVSRPGLSEDDAELFKRLTEDGDFFPIHGLYSSYPLPDAS